MTKIKVGVLVTASAVILAGGGLVSAQQGSVRVAAVPPATVANTGMITGRAVERDGTPAVAAVIVVRSGRGLEIGTGRTGTNGVFAVAVPVGDNIWVQIQGKRAGRATGVIVKAGEKTDVGTIKLSEMRQ